MRIDLLSKTIMFVSSLLFSQPAVSQGLIQKSQENFLIQLISDPTALFTCALFIATGLLYWATRALVKSGEKNSAKQLRAYVSAQPNFIFDFSTTQLVTMRYLIKNHGQTPAYSIQLSALVDILPFPLPNGFHLPAISKLNPTTTTVHQGEEIFGNVVAQRYFTAQEIHDAVTNNGCRIYCFGVVTYESFDKLYRTNFCRSVVGSPNLALVGNGGTANAVHIDYEFADQHNQSD